MEINKSKFQCSKVSELQTFKFPSFQSFKVSIKDSQIDFMLLIDIDPIPKILNNLLDGYSEYVGLIFATLSIFRFPKFLYSPKQYFRERFGLLLELFEVTWCPKNQI